MGVGTSGRLAMAASLERRQWLSRERDPANRRYYRLRLTRRGKDAAARVGGHFRAIHAALFDALTPAERAGLELGLAGLIRALDSPDRRATA